MKSRIDRFLGHIGLKKKIIGSFIILSVFIILSFGFVSYQYSSDLVEIRTKAQAEETVHLLSRSVDNNILLVMDRFSTLTYDMQLQQYLRMSKEEVDKSSKSKIQNEVSRMMVTAYSSMMLRDIQIYALNGFEFGISDGRSLQYDIPEEYTQIADNAGGRIVIIDEDEENLQFVKQIKDSQRLKTLGYLRSAFKKSYLYNLMHDIDFASEGEIMIYDEAGNMLIGNISHFDDMSVFAGQKGEFNYRYDGKSYLTIYDKLENVEWIVVGLMPLGGIGSDMIQFGLIGIVFAVLLIVLCIAVGNILIKNIITPVDDIVEALNAFSKGDFDTMLPVDRSDEMGSLSIGYNQMLVKINALIDNNYRSQILKKECELKMLQAQINPHFLYNTLETINWMARKNDMNEICDLISAVGDLMRISISNKKSYVTVREEMKLVSEYLYIQKIRYRDKLQTEIMADDNMLDYMIPKLIIQPIVENAVVHGIEKKKEGGAVNIRGFLQDSKLCFIVYDTGIGMSEETIQKVMSHSNDISSESHTGLGAYTVYQRIAYIYGAEGKFEITSKQGEYTKIVIEIPAWDVAHFK